MLFIEAERMTNCLYDPEDCESERTVIISELQGGENDPDTLLDQELTAVAFKAHPYRHPTIGWLSDLQAMNRDDLYSYYRRFYVPNNATLVIVGDIDKTEAMRAVVQHFDRIGPGDVSRRPPTKEPEQLGERRLTLTREGTTAYLKLGYRAPSIADPDFFPMLVLDAILTGAKGVNLWASFRTPPAQRSARLYRALVDRGLASSVSGGLVPTAEPFLYTLSLTATTGTPLARLEEVVLNELEDVRTHGISRGELEKAIHQLRARLVFENDSITNIAHQLGYFETIDSWRWLGSLHTAIELVTADQVRTAAFERLKSTNRTIGWFEPLPVGSAGTAAAGEGAGAGPVSARGPVLGKR
jgi:zinc protease